MGGRDIHIHDCVIENFDDAVALKPQHNGQGLTLVHFSAQPNPFWSHLPVSPCLTDWGEIMHPTYQTKCAYIELKSGRV